MRLSVWLVEFTKLLGGWRLHPLKGDRKGVWSLTVTRNHRLTFRVTGSVVSEIDFEDYH